MNAKQRTVAEMMKEDALHVVEALRSLLVSYGIVRETVNELLAKTTDELMHTRKKQYWRVRCHADYTLSTVGADYAAFLDPLCLGHKEG